MIHKTKKRSLDEADKPAKCNGKIAPEESKNGGENSRKMKKLKVSPPAVAMSELKAKKRRSQEEEKDVDHPLNVKKKKKKKRDELMDPQTSSGSLKHLKNETNVIEQSSASPGINTKSLKELKKEKKKLLKLLKNENLETNSEKKSKSESMNASTDAGLLKKPKKKNKKSEEPKKLKVDVDGDTNVLGKAKKEQVRQLKKIKHSLGDCNPKKKVHSKKESKMNQVSSTDSKNPDTPRVEFLSEKLKKIGLKQLAKSKSLSNDDLYKAFVKDSEPGKINEADLASPIVAQESNKKKKKKKKKEKKGKDAEDKSKKEKLEESNDPSPKTDESKKSKEKKVISSKRKEFFKKKREQFKENKKLLKLQTETSGGSTSSDNMSLEEIKEKILELQNRETLSNTAKRKLRVLKKKAQVLQSAEHDQSQKVEGDIRAEHVKDTDKKSKKSKKNSSIGDLSQKHGRTVDKEAKKSKKNSLVGDKEDSTEITKNTNNKALPNSKVDRKKKKEMGKGAQKPLFIEDREGDNSLKIAQNKKNEYKLLTSGSKKSTSELANGSGQNNGSTSEEESDKSGFKDYLSNVKEQMESENSGGSSSDEGGIEGEDQKDEESDDSSPHVIVTPTKARTNQFQSSSFKSQNKKVETPGKKQRYVLFVGNLAYDSTTVDLKKHFLTKVDRVKDVRIPLAPGTNKPRGFAYVEVETSEDYEKGLSLHGTFVRGRPLKVEYTTSGSKSSGKKKEIVHKNKKLHAMRKAGMLAGSKKKRNPKKDSNKSQEKSQN